MKTTSSCLPPEVAAQSLATFIEARVVEHGDAVQVLLRERDGTISTIRIGVEQLAD